MFSLWISNTVPIVIIVFILETNLIILVSGRTTVLYCDNKTKVNMPKTSSDDRHRGFCNILQSSKASPHQKQGMHTQSKSNWFVHRVLALPYVIATKHWTKAPPTRTWQSIERISLHGYPCLKTMRTHAPNLVNVIPFACPQAFPLIARARAPRGYERGRGGAVLLHRVFHQLGARRSVETI